MSELKLDLADLEVETIVADVTEQNDLRAVTTGNVGHGMAEIGASCCKIVEAGGQGSCSQVEGGEFLG